MLVDEPPQTLVGQKHVTLEALAGPSVQRPPSEGAGRDTEDDAKSRPR